MRKNRSVFATVGAVLLLTGCRPIPSQEPASFSSGHEELQAYPVPSQGYYYNCLNQSQKTAYGEMYNACLRFASHVELTPLSQNDYLVACQAFTMDHPEFYWTDQGTQYYFNNYGSVVRASYDMNGNEKETFAQLEDIAQGIVRSISYDATTYQKLKYIYEYIVWNTDYDTSPREEDRLGQDITSVFLDHSAVCGGYARAFLYLCGKAGVDGAMVIGDAANMTNGSHAWNIVRIASNWYWVDPTWGDPVDEPGIQSINYNYFCVDDATIGVDHFIDRTLGLGNKGISFVCDYPVCQDSSIDYFHVNGSYFEDYSPDLVHMYIRKRIEKGHVSRISMRFASSEALENAIEDLIDNYVVFDIVSATRTQSEVIRYSANEKLHILNITVVVQ